MNEIFFNPVLGTDTEPQKRTPYQFETTDTCPVCGEEVYRNGRCKTCLECGWSSCEL